MTQVIEEVYLKNRANNNPQAPKTLARLVTDSARSRTLDQSLAILIESNALGYPTFATTYPWAVGAVVFYDRKLWKFTTAHTANTPWNSNEVEEFSIKEVIEALNAAKANTEGDYPKISAGSAKNINKDINVVSSFIERTSGGDEEIANGLAKLGEIGGKSVKFNQLVEDRFSNIAKWTYSATGIILGFNNHIATVKARWGGGAINFAYDDFVAVVGHKYLFSIIYTPSVNNTIGLLCGDKEVTRKSVTSNTRYKIAGIVNYTTVSADGKLRIKPNYDEVAAANDILGVCEDPMVIDLTAMGIDNLTTVAQVEAWLASNLGLKNYYPYTPNTVVNVTMNGIESTNRNLLDPTTGKAELIGAYSEIYGNYYAIRGTYTSLSLESIDGEVTTPTPDADGKFLVEKKSTLTVSGAGADCIVFLWWDGTQTSFVEHKVDNARVDIPCIYGKANGAGELVEVFPDGACGIGDDKDLLTIESGVAVVKKLIGKRAYASGDESDSDVITDGTNTYYVLTTPITYTDLVYVGSSYYDDNTPVTLPVNYEVDNWGIERITSEGLTVVPQISCKYSIDIVETANTLSDEIDFLDDKKANTKGEYPDIISGASKTIVNNTPIIDTFLYRKSGGSSIESGVAKMTNVKGNSRSWNQLVRDTFTSSTENDITISANTTDHCFNFSGEGSGSYSINKKILNFIVGHKYYYRHDVIENPNNLTTIRYGLANQVSGACVSADLHFAYVFVSNSTGNGIGIDGGANGVDVTGLKVRFKVIDLTLLGIDNLTTVAEVESWLAKNVGLKDYYPYDAGSILNTKMKGFESVGFNQWDEQWEVGKINDTTGENDVSTTNIRSKNFIPALPDTTYSVVSNISVVSNAHIRVFFYDSNMSFISGSSWLQQFTTPINCRYIKLKTDSTYGNTYNHDICINISNAQRNGTYEPYWKKNFPFDVTTMTGVNSVTGEREVMFPNGMRGVGSAIDEIYSQNGKAIGVKRMESVDLGTQNYYLSESIENTFSCITLANRKANRNLLCPKYVNKNTPGISDIADKMILGTQSSSEFFIRDSSYSDTTTFKTAMNGVPLIYELATPITYTDLQDADGNPIELPVTYQVDKDGTEEVIIPASVNGEPTSAAPTLENVYSLDAVGTLQKLPQDYISKESMQSFLGTLGTAMNGTWSMTWDSTNNRYGYTFTPNE